MKKVVIALMGALFFGSALNLAVAKELTPKEVVEKAAKQHKTDKLGKKAAKGKKDWQPWESALPIEDQLSMAYAYDYAVDDNNERYFYDGEGEYTSNNKGTAYQYAYKIALGQIAASMEANIAGGGSVELVDNGGNASTSGQQTIRDIFASKLAGTQPVVRMYKKSGNDYSVSIRVFYPRNRANAIAAEALAKQNKVDGNLKKDVDDQLKKLIDK